MPNKYSHAIVLSNYEAQGITDFNRSCVVTTGLPSAKTAKTSSSPSIKSTASHSSSSIVFHHTNFSSPAFSSDRIHLGDAPDPSLARAPYLRHHRIHESIDTREILPMQHSLAQEWESAYDTAHQGPCQPPPSSLAEPDAISRSERQKHAGHPTASPRPMTRHVLIPSIETLDIAIDDSESLKSGSLRRRLTSDTAIWDPQPTTPSSPHKAAQLSVLKLLSQQPPTPPLTPKTRNSSESFSLATHLDELSPSPPPPPPPLPLPNTQSLPNRIPHLSPPSSRVEDSDSPPRTLGLSLLPASSRPQTSAGLPDLIRCISTRRSSLNATSSVKSAFLPSPRPDTYYSQDPPATPDRRSSFEFETDLEPLPPDLGIDLESISMPWDERPRGVETFHPLTAERPSSSRASSFDSAAPPPISRGRNLPQGVTTAPRNPGPPPPSSKSNKLSKKTKSSFSFFGTGSSSTPKAIPYSNTKPGKAPISVSISRTAAPSIPALFSSYRGAFPPGPDSAMPLTEKRAASIPTRHPDLGDVPSATSEKHSVSSRRGSVTSGKSRGRRYSFLGRASAGAGAGIRD
ncbi:MAG: hypothetical protein Q9163_004224 [Psora crenata]